MSEDTKLVVRTSKGLQDCLFDEIDDLHAGRVTPQSSRTIAALASGILQTARLEMDAARFVTEQRGSADLGDTTKAIKFGTS